MNLQGGLAFLIGFYLIGFALEFECDLFILKDFAVFVYKLCSELDGLSLLDLDVFGYYSGFDCNLI